MDPLPISRDYSNVSFPRIISHPSGPDSKPQRFVSTPCGVFYQFDVVSGEHGHFSLLELPKFHAVSGFKKHPKVIKNAKNLTLFCVTTE